MFACHTAHNFATVEWKMPLIASASLHEKHIIWAQANTSHRGAVIDDKLVDSGRLITARLTSDPRNIEAANFW